MPPVDPRKENYDLSRTLPGGARELARLHLIAKPRPDGLAIFAPCVDGEYLYTPDPPDPPQPAPEPPPDPFEGLELCFELRAQNPDFDLFTALKLPSMPPGHEAWPNRRASRPTYINDPADDLEPELELESGAAVVPPGLLGFALISGIRSSWLRQGRHFTITFAAPQLRWTYYVVTRSGKSPKITDTSISESTIEFESVAVNAVELEADPIAAQLRERYPAHMRYRVQSTTNVACRRKPEHKLKLDWINSDSSSGSGASMSSGPWLAFPSIQNFSRFKHKLQPADDKAVELSSLFRIIKH